MFSLFSAMFLIPSVAKADIAPIQDSIFDYCFRVENVNDYPDYVFLAHQEATNSYDIVQNNSIHCDYSQSLYAMKKDVYESGLGKIIPNNINEKSFDYSVRNYFAGPDVFKSNFVLGATKGEKHTLNPIEHVITVLKVTDISDKIVKVDVVAVENDYWFGIREQRNDLDSNSYLSGLGIIIFLIVYFLPLSLLVWLLTRFYLKVTPVVRKFTLIYLLIIFFLSILGVYFTKITDWGASIDIILTQLGRVFQMLYFALMLLVFVLMTRKKVASTKLDGILLFLIVLGFLFVLTVYVPYYQKHMLFSLIVGD